MPPFWSCRFADCILITEESDLVHRLLLTAGFQPLHGDKILGLVGVISIPVIEIAVLKYIYRQLFTVVSVDGEATSWFNGALYNTDADVTCCRNFHPDAVARLKLF